MSLRSLKRKFGHVPLVGGRKKILLAVGVYRYPDPQTIMKLIDMWSDFGTLGMGYDVILRLTTSSAITRMRSDSARIVLEDPAYEYVLYVDDDMCFPVASGISKDGEKLRGFNPLERLIARGKDIVGGLAFSRQLPMRPFVAHEGEDGQPSDVENLVEIAAKGDPFQVDFIGFGMVLVHRRALIRVAEACSGNFEAFFGQDSNWRSLEFVREALSDFLKRDGRTVTDLIRLVDDLQAQSKTLEEDYSFCRRARRAGCTIWCDPSFELQHFGKYAYSIHDWLAQQKFRQEEQLEMAAAIAARGVEAGA